MCYGFGVDLIVPHADGVLMQNLMLCMTTKCNFLHKVISYVNDNAVDCMHFCMRGLWVMLTKYKYKLLEKDLEGLMVNNIYSYVARPLCGS